MSGISSIAGTSQLSMPQSVTRTAREGSPTEESRESPAEKASEKQQNTGTATASPAPSAKGIGGAINIMA